MGRAAGVPGGRLETGDSSELRAREQLLNRFLASLVSRIAARTATVRTVPIRGNQSHLLCAGKRRKSFGAALGAVIAPTSFSLCGRSGLHIGRGCCCLL